MMAGDPTVKPEKAVIDAVRESEEVATPQDVVKNLSKLGLEETLVSTAILRLLNEQQLILRWDRSLELPSKFYKDLARLREAATDVWRAVENGALSQAVKANKALATIVENQKWSDLANGQAWQQFADAVRQMQRVNFSQRNLDQLSQAARRLGETTTKLSELSKALETRYGARNASSSAVMGKSPARLRKATVESAAISRKEGPKARATSSKTSKTSGAKSEKKTPKSRAISGKASTRSGTPLRKKTSAESS